MKTKPVIPRARANEDVDEAIAHYLDEDTRDVALDFIDALERTYARIARHPSSGSPRYAHELSIPALRCRSVPRYPHYVFYVERATFIDVWRVLHAHRDISARLTEDLPNEPGKPVVKRRSR